MAMALRAMRGASGPRARTGAIGWKVGCRGRGAFGTDRRRNARTAAAEGNGGRTDLPGEDVVFESEKLALQVRELKTFERNWLGRWRGSRADSWSADRRRGWCFSPRAVANTFF